MIELQGVSKHYGDGGVVALDGIDLRVQTGEILALTGPSGSGKTTLLNLIGAIDRPTSGRLQVDGNDLLNGTKLSRFRARSVGLVFQFHYLLANLTALENVMLPLYPDGCRRRERRHRAMTLLREVGLADRSDELPGKLSGGERQRVALARALANRPGILLADEPTGSLDADAGAQLVDLVLDYCADRPATLIIATHNESVAARAQRRLRLEFGRIISD